MKRIGLVLLAAALVVMPAAAKADVISVGDFVIVTDVTAGDYAANGSYNGAGGGTWWLDNVTNPNAADFMTFCIELAEQISLGTQFVVDSIEPYAVKGGVGAINDKDYLSIETQALYLHFRLDAPQFTGDALQRAFWYYEDAAPLDSITNPAYVWANANAAAYLAANPGYEVNALNLKWANGADAQSLLTLQSVVPDGGATLMLLGGALMGLGALRRKFRG